MNYCLAVHASIARTEGVSSPRELMPLHGSMVRICFSIAWSFMVYTTGLDLRIVGSGTNSEPAISLALANVEVDSTALPPFVCCNESPCKAWWPRFVEQNVLSR